MLYAFFWVITRRLEFICRRFRTLCLFHLHRHVDVSSSFYSHLPAYEDGIDSVFRNVGIQTPDARVLPKRKHTTRTCFSATTHKIIQKCKTPVIDQLKIQGKVTDR
jgi:hypothetical protein